MVTREDYARRIARVAAAQSTGVQPRPDYALSMAVGAAPMPQAAFDHMVNGIRFDAEAIARAEEQRKMFLENVGGLFSFVERLRRGAKAKRERPGFTWGDTFNQDDEKSWWEDVKADAGAVARGVGGVFGAVTSALSGDSDFETTTTSLDGDGEEVDQAAVQNVDVIGPVMAALDKVDRGLNTVGNIANIEGERGLNFWESWSDPEIRHEAWQRGVDGVTFGRAAADSLFMDADRRVEAYEAGFDEYGNPEDEQYRRLWESNGWYNLTSGSIDFAKTWFADPLVVAGKGASVGRAIYKGDTLRMAPGTARRFTEILTASDEALQHMNIRKMDVVGQRALAVRKEKLEWRDKLRTGEIDSLWLANNVQSFEAAPAAAEALSRAAKVRRWDSEAGRLGDEFNDDAYMLTLRALMEPTSGPARAALAASPDLAHVNDAINVLDDGGVVRSVQGALKESEEIVAAWEGRDPLRWSSVYDDVIRGRENLAERRLEAEALTEQLKEYREYESWYKGLLDSVEKGTITMAPREGHSVGETFWASFKPNSSATKGQTVVGATKAAFMRRPGVANHHDPNQTFESARRYLDSARVRGGYHDDVADARGYTSWSSMQDDFLRRTLAATTDTQRQKILAEIEDAALESVYRKRGIDAEQMANMTTQFRTHRGRVFADFHKKHEELGALGQADSAPKGFSSYSVAEGDEVITHLFPLSATELKNTTVLMDLQAVDQFIASHGDGFAAMLRRGADVAEEAFAWYTRFWKPSVLFRFGYAIRNVTDEMLRAIAVASSYPTLIGYTVASGATSALGRGVPMLANRAARRAAKTRFVGRRARRHIEENNGVFRVMKPYGSGKTRVRGHQFEAVYAEGTGDVFRGEISEDLANRKLARYQDDAYRGMQREQAQMPVRNPSDPDFLEVWHAQLSQHVAKDPIWRQMLDGHVQGLAVGEVDDSIIKWLRTTREGRALRERMKWNGNNPTRWVHKMRNVYSEMVPDQVLASKLLDPKGVSVEDLRRVAESGGKVPTQVDGMMVATAQGRSKLAEGVNKILEGGYRVLGTVPTDVLVRHPFANQMYRSSLRRQVDQLDWPRGKPIPQNVMREMEKGARDFAVKQTRRYMFSLADDTNMVHFMRFMSPFMGAWQESMLKWGRIALENPESMVRLWVNGWANLENAYGIQSVTEDGYDEETEAQVAEAEGRERKPLDHIQVPLMGRTIEGLKKFLPGNPEVASDIFKSVEFKKENANVITQGSYWFLPGVGPIVQLPAQLMYGDSPEWSTEEGMKKFLWDYAIAPAGKQDVKDYLLPSATVREAVDLVQGMDSTKFKGLANDAYKHMYTQWIAEGRDPATKPTIEEAIEVAKATQATNVVGRLFTPAAYQALPDGKVPSGHSGAFLQDQARAYQTLYGFEEGAAKFLEDFGEDNYIWLTSTSGSDSTLPPTGKGWKGWKKYSEQIREHPELALAIVGMDADDDEFAMAIYQEEMGLGFRDRLTPDQVRDKSEREQGWREWRKLTTEIDTELAARYNPRNPGQPLTIGSREAADLAYLKQMREQELRALYPGWAADFDENNRGANYQRVEAFKELVAKGGTFMERPDWKYGVTEFLEMNDAFVQELEARRAYGLSANITAEDNADLSALWDTAIQDLLLRNPMFADMYHRFLENYRPTMGAYAQLPVSEQQEEG